MGAIVTAGEVAAAWPEFSDLEIAEQAALIQAASHLIQNYTHRTWAIAAATELYNGTGTVNLMLRRHPATVASAVTVNGVTVTDYKLDTLRSVLVRGDYDDDPELSTAYWDRGTNNVSVTYTAGVEPNLAIRRAGVLLVKDLSQRTEAGAFRREKIGDYEYEMSGQEVSVYGMLPSVVQMLLAPYVDMRRR
jgi:hypothetical protein